MHIRIATRKSALALWQAEFVAERLRQEKGVAAVSLVPLSTRGDEVLDRSLQKIGGKGLFIKELELAIQTGDADIAVHSMKDVPADLPAGFCIAAVLERASPFDALVSGKAENLNALPRGAIVGSSSLRRQAQLLALRPDLEIRPLRGNVNTRLARLRQGHYDAIILACAGLERLGLAQHIRERIGIATMLPAAAQGVIGIECRSEQRDLRQLLERLDHPETKQTTCAERAVARHLQASCHSPVASYAIVQQGKLLLRALVASADGRKVLRQEMTADIERADTLGTQVAQSLIDDGAAELLAETGDA